MKVFLSNLAEAKLLSISEYLLENWDKKTRDRFISTFKGKIEQISKQPESCPKSNILKGLYKCVVTKHNTFYYQISKDDEEIEIITIFDTRQSPRKLKKDLKNDF